MNMIKQKKMFKIDNLNTSMSQAGEIYFYLAAIACIDGKMKKVEADLLKELGQKLNLPVDFQKAVMKYVFQIVMMMILILMVMVV